MAHGTRICNFNPDMLLFQQLANRVLTYETCSHI